MRRVLYNSLQKQRRTVKQPVKRPKDEEDPPRRASPKFGGRAMFYVQSRSLQQSPLPTSSRPPGSLQDVASTAT